MSADSSHEIEAEAPETPEAVSTAAMAARVAEALRERIVRGQLSAGDRIVERKLSAELSVSRTPVREALKLLEADGLIEISKNRGAQVTALGAEEALQLFDVIAVLEGLAAQRLAEGGAPAELKRLEALHAAMKAHFEAGALEPYFDANSAIHALVLSGCGNPMLEENHRRLMLKARRGRYMAIMSHDRWAQSVDEHEALMGALRAKNGDAAFAIWRTHLRHTGEAVAAALTAQEAAEAV